MINNTLIFHVAQDEGEDEDEDEVEEEEEEEDVDGAEGEDAVT